jgi:hypothetical protein
MTPAQQMEVRRFTYSMWTMLEHARKMHPSEAEIGGPYMRTARILERRGFLFRDRHAKTLQRPPHRSRSGSPGIEGRKVISAGVCG